MIAVLGRFRLRAAPLYYGVLFLLTLLVGGIAFGEAWCSILLDAYAWGTLALAATLALTGCGPIRAPSVGFAIFAGGWFLLLWADLEQFRGPGFQIAQRSSEVYERLVRKPLPLYDFPPHLAMYRNVRSYGIQTVWLADMNRYSVELQTRAAAAARLGDVVNIYLAFLLGGLGAWFAARVARSESAPHQLQAH